MHRAAVSVQLQLVGLSVLDTARKLKMHCRNEGIYDAFVKDFLPESGRSAQAQRCSRTRFAIECDVLATKQQFEQLLAKAEQVGWLYFPMLVPWHVHGLYQNAFGHGWSQAQVWSTTGGYACAWVDMEMWSTVIRPADGLRVLANKR